MTELRNGDIIYLVCGKTVTIIKEIGRGGQGIVYIVDLNGKQMALKWYLNGSNDKFYTNLRNNVTSGTPSNAFLWPLYITEKQKGSFGYVMHLRPKGYYEFSDYLLAKVRFSSITATLSAAMKICDGFMNLHRLGYSYQDLNDGNFFIRPTDGDVLICDNDNVMAQGEVSGIKGKARYMAPEVVLGTSMPNKYSDRFSLSVILFMIFYLNHPFEGARVAACPCLTEDYEKKFYGSEAIFICSPTNKSNPPVRGLHNNVIRFWPVLPKILRDTFIQEFSDDRLKNPSKRLLETQWKEIISQIRDSLIKCPYCTNETFFDREHITCVNCGQPIKVTNHLIINSKRDISITLGRFIYLDYDNTPDIRVVKDQKGILLLQNISNDKWTVETLSGKTLVIEPQKIVPVKPGLKITFKVNNETFKGLIK